MDKIKLETYKISLLNNFRREMNGAVASAMRSNNALEGLQSYGVSLPTIKAICNELGKNNELALYVFNSKVRELKLAATFLVEPEKITYEEIIFWCDTTSNKEILQSIIQFSVETSFAKQLFSFWSEKYEDDKYRSLAIYLGGRLIKKGESVDKSYLFPLLEKCDNNDINSVVFLLNALQNKNKNIFNEIILLLKHTNTETTNEITNFFI